MEAKIQRECLKCGRIIKITVFYEEKNGKIEVSPSHWRCPYCSGFLKTPTPEEVRKTT